MPRKMFRSPEDAAPIERPGAGSPDDSGVRRRPRVEETSVELDPAYAEEVKSKRHKELQGMVSELVEEQAQEQAKTKKKNREQVESQVGELLDIEKSRMAAEQHREALQVERADIQQRIKEMGGIWGEESFFVLEDRLAEIRKELGEAVEAKPVTQGPAKRETTPLEFSQGVVKALEKKRKNLDAQQNKVREELKKYGIGSMDQINFELEQMEDEIRAETENKKPGLGYRFMKFFRRMAGQEVSPQAKAALKKYHELEVQQNANTRDMTEAQNQAYASGEKRPRPRELRASVSESETYVGGVRGGSAALGSASLEGSAKTFTEAPAAIKGSRELSKQIAELKEAEGSHLAEQRERYAELEKEMEGLRAEAVAGGAIPEEFDRLVAKLEKTKDKELALLVQGYQRKMKQAEGLRKELGLDVVPEASLRVEAARARAHAETQEQRRGRFAEKPVAEQQQESREKMLLQEVRETTGFIKDAINNLEGVKDEMDVLADQELFETKRDDFSKLIRKYETLGQGETFDKALQAAEDELARYSAALTTRLARVRKQAAEAGPGQARPESMIIRRSGMAGTYGTGAESRTRVEASRLVTPETAERQQKELVNKDVALYRMEKDRSKWINYINADAEWRSFMHGVYEDVTARLKQLGAEGHDVSTTRLNTPDMALDYALALFRAHAHATENGGFTNPTDSDRKMALEEVKRWDSILGWGERYKLKEEERAEPLKREKRSRNARELEAIEESVEPELTISELSPEEQAEVEAANVEDLVRERSAIKEKEETLSVKEAQARFDKINRELEAMGVTSLADKMEDKAFLKADADLRHARRAARVETGKRSAKKYKEQKEEPVLTFSEPTPEEQAEIDAAEEADLGIPSLKELQALAASPDNENTFPKHEDLVHMQVPEGRIQIEESTPKASKEGSKRPSLHATLEERLNASASKQAKSKKKRGA